MVVVGVTKECTHGRTRLKLVYWGGMYEKGSNDNICGSYFLFDFLFCEEM